MTGCKRVAHHVKHYMARERLQLQPDSTFGTDGGNTGGKNTKNPGDEF